MNIHRSIRRLRQKLFLRFCKLRGLHMVHFLHIGKTGGSAVKHALKPHPVTTGFALVLHSHGTTLRDIPVGERAFFFLRDPIDRFISGFYSRKRQGQPRYFAPWTPDEAVAFQTFETPNQLGLAIGSDDIELRNKAVHAMKSIGHVRDFFRNWFESEEYLVSRKSDLLLIGFQKSLDDDFERLKKVLNLPEHLTLPKDDIQSHRNPKDVDKKLDEAAILNLRKWYEEDYRLFVRCQSISNDL